MQLIKTKDQQIRCILTISGISNASYPSLWCTFLLRDRKSRQTSSAANHNWSVWNEPLISSWFITLRLNIDNNNNHHYNNRSIRVGDRTKRMQLLSAREQFYSTLPNELIDSNHKSRFLRSMQSRDSSNIAMYRYAESRQRAIMGWLLWSHHHLVRRYDNIESSRNTFPLNWKEMFKQHRSSVTRSVNFWVTRVEHLITINHPTGQHHLTWFNTTLMSCGAKVCPVPGVFSSMKKTSMSNATGIDS